jgi:hypothetical protein
LISPDRVGALNAHQDRVRTLSQDVRPSGGPRLEGIVSGWVVLLHVAVAFWFVAGLLGRNLTLARRGPAGGSGRSMSWSSWPAASTG